MAAAKAFIDSNIILYMLATDGAKARTAESILHTGGTISVQVLNEIASVAIRKLDMTWEETNQFLLPLRSLCTVEPLTLETHDRGREIAERFQLSVYDSIIVGAALLADCTVLYSEDMHDGLRIEKTLQIVNPFKNAEQ
jgi:predicted nucleic acid-binding protein